MRKVQKTYFWGHFQGKNFRQLVSERLPGKMHLLQKCLERNFRAACKKLDNSDGQEPRSSLISSTWLGNFGQSLLSGRGPFPSLIDFCCCCAAIQIALLLRSFDYFSSFIAAAPRPLRLRRGFVVTTAPLNDMLTLTTYDFLLQLCKNFVKENHKFERNYFQLEHRKILQSSAIERCHEDIMKPQFYKLVIKNKTDNYSS